MTGASLPAHLYLHVPVCRSKCAYCDFFSLPVGGLPVPNHSLVAALTAQADSFALRGVPTRPLETLYVGGGTPTAVGQHLPELVRRLLGTFGRAAGCEVTVEANPESLTRELADGLADAGVTRISVGVQSLDDELLSLLGRPHCADEARAAAGHVTASGVDLAVDLMCGLPGQDMDTWTRTLEEAIALEPSHASVYPLSVETGTPLAAAIDQRTLPEPDPDLAAAMMVAAEDRLESAGLARYEVANYAVPGHESAHNTAYWTGREYLGVGPGAHGMLNALTAQALGMEDCGQPGSPVNGEVDRSGGPGPRHPARIRYAVPADFGEGLSEWPRFEIEGLTATEALREDAMLGLRLREGIEDSLVRDAGATRALEALASAGLVERAGSRWRTTRRGWLLGNEVFAGVWLSE